MLVFINVQILEYFVFHVTHSLKRIFRERHLKDTNVWGNVRLGLGKTLGRCGESGETVFSN